MSTLNMTMIISVALFGSFGHCIGMCGGFVAAVNSGKMDADTLRAKRLFLHTIYHFGRISSYVLIGIICALLGRVFMFSPKAQGILLFAVGIFMVLIGVSLVGKSKFLSFFENIFSFKFFPRKAYSFLISSKQTSSFYFLGALNGFIPCGFVYFFAAFAVASDSVFAGGLTMLIFGLFTLPAMIGFGFALGLIEFRDMMVKLAGLIVVGYGIYLSYHGYIMVIG